MTNHTTFQGYAIAMSDTGNHPYQKQLRFVFTDFSPNGNKQGVGRAEVENLKRTSRNMPVKVSFDGELVYGHGGAIPVGPIVNMREEDGVLIAEAVLWSDEFPELTEYLESTDPKDVNFSWELYYGTSTLDAEGNEWLQDVTVAAATIVDNPAYKGRTHLIAMASDTTKLEERVENIESIVAQALQELRDLRGEAMGDVLEVTESETLESVAMTSLPTTEFEALQVELDYLRTFKNDIEVQASRAELLNSRKAEMSAAGLSTELTDEQAEMIEMLQDGQFALYLEMLKDAAQKAASRSIAENRNGPVLIPDPTIGSQHETTVPIKKLAQGLRKNKTRE